MTTIPDDYDHAADDVVQNILLDLADDLSEMNDGDEPAFGVYARTEGWKWGEGNRLVVRHETDDAPAVRITVERIA
jgi:hypothetical protein